VTIGFSFFFFLFFLGWLFLLICVNFDGIIVIGTFIHVRSIGTLLA